MVNKALVGKGFDTVLFKYNDVDVDKAMDTIPGTPQNLAHDGKRFYYFNSDATFRSTSVGSYAGAAGGSWQIDETHIILTMDAGAQFKIPYQIKDNTVLFPNWDDYSNGNKYTYQFIPDNSAKSYIEGKSLQS